ncbi:adenylyl-sulfate kinase [Cellvibrio sp. OA-2007]|uniref:adenylyl-sulfate kinase n=1 Tax=Cellvibrio sp. OA-2007 TaxID=529823 RepID=UPI000781B0C0|nr:adenylyl-sulfate kinase [Cellvibrio sp. OA-2007]
MSFTADQYQIRIAWQSVRPLVAGRTYLLRRGQQELLVSVTALKYRKDDKTGEHLSAKKLNAGETGIANISTAQAISVDEHKSADIDILDLQTSELLGKGHIEFPLYRATNIRWQSLSVDKSLRAAMKQQQPRCIWFTGLSGSGKSTLANMLEKRLCERGLHTYLLDGDNLRHGLNRDLGFTEADRVENIRRVAEVAKLMVDAGLIVLASFISPFQAERQMARRLFDVTEFVEVFVDTPLSECERRDVKGLYAKARRGELKNFTGIDSVYERPEHPELVVDTCDHSVEYCVEQIINTLLPADVGQ